MEVQGRRGASSHDQPQVDGLVQVIRDGTDPHAFTAALFEGMCLEDFLQLKCDDPSRFKQLRQRAKALNFGIPGGLGAASLVSYAESTYGVRMTLEDAETFRRRVIEEIYPELGQYLREDACVNLAHNLRADESLVRSCFQSARALRNVVRGRTCKADGTPYNEAWLQRVWDALIKLNQNPQLADMLRPGVGSDELHDQLFWGPVMTMTGRLRGRVSYSQARNAPFQGLAADGAKLALWKLTMAGYRLVAFIHDEALIELPKDIDHTAHATNIERILCEAMQEMTGTVPVECEYSLSERWSKEAVAVFDDDGHLLPWSANGVTEEHDAD